MSGARVRANLEAMTRARIFFAHQSVGRNILEGLMRLAQDHAVDALSVVELSPGNPTPERTLAHASVGRNTDPVSKLTDFSKQLRAQAQNPPDIALMKFCYVDFDPGSDAEALFRDYSQTLRALGEEFPGVRFLHMSVPLTVRMLRLKDRVKLLLGKPLWVDEANAVRERFNERLRESHPEQEIVDIARIESTFPDGARCIETVHGVPVPSMVHSYSDDGGHLNALGQRLLATEFARVVAANLETN